MATSQRDLFREVARMKEALQALSLISDVLAECHMLEDETIRVALYALNKYIVDGK